MLYLFAFLSIFANAFNVGFNQAWFKNDYGHQWSNPEYSPAEVRRLLDLTKQAGGKTFRIWMFEGVDNNALTWKDGKVSGLHPDLLKNLEDFLVACRERDIKAYLTFFDANTIKDLWKGGEWVAPYWNLLNGDFGGREAFVKNAMLPILKLIYREDLRPSIFGLDIMNEVDAAVSFKRFRNDWYSVNEMTCSLRRVVRDHSANQEPIPVTISIGWPAIPGFSAGAGNLILDPNPHPSCVDFWDIHFYNNEGSIPNCEKIKQVSLNYKKPIYLGEFGQRSGEFDDALQLKTTQNFVNNARSCGLAGALAWRLSDIRPGHNKEARFSFEANGKLRPAFDWITSFNQK